MALSENTQVKYKYLKIVLEYSTKVNVLSTTGLYFIFCWMVGTVIVTCMLKKSTIIRSTIKPI